MEEVKQENKGRKIAYGVLIAVVVLFIFFNVYKVFSNKQVNSELLSGAKESCGDSTPKQIISNPYSKDCYFIDCVNITGGQVTADKSVMFCK